MAIFQMSMENPVPFEGMEYKTMKISVFNLISYENLISDMPEIPEISETFFLYEKKTVNDEQYNENVR